MFFLVCECACVHFNVGTHGCGHTKARELLQGTRMPSSLFSRQGFSLNLELGDLARLAGQGAQGILLSLFTQSGITGICHYA